MSQDDGKRAAARAALDLVAAGSWLGVGTGSTADIFVDALAADGPQIRGAVASSEATAARLRRHGFVVVELDEVGELPLYVDGADEATRRRELVKGGGGALTREKIVAEASLRFACIVDDSKIVERLGGFPVPLEVIPMALGLVRRRVALLGGRAERRFGFVTDNGNAILDVHDLRIDDPAGLESRLNQIPGVVTCGLFCRRPADLVIVGGAAGVETLET